MQALLVVFASIAALVSLIIWIERRLNKDVNEMDGVKTYGDNPIYRWVLVGFLTLALISGIIFIVFFLPDGAESSSKFPLLIFKMGLIGFLAYRYGFTGTKNAISFSATTISVIVNNDRHTFSYNELKDIYIPRTWSWKRISTSAEGPRFTAPDGTQFELKASLFGVGLKARFISAEFRKRLEAAGVPYTT